MRAATAALRSGLNLHPRLSLRRSGDSAKAAEGWRRKGMLCLPPPHTPLRTNVYCRALHACRAPVPGQPVAREEGKTQNSQSGGS